MIDAMKEAKQKKSFKYYSFLAGIKLRITIIKYKLKLLYKDLLIRIIDYKYNRLKKKKDHII